MENLQKRLEAIAWKKSIPFCYGCYKVASMGCCVTCRSDDLMRFVEGVGVEYGIEWVLKHLIETNLTPADTSAAFEDSVSGSYPDNVEIGWMEFDTVSALKTLDPIAWNCAESEWVDSEISDENLMTFDNGASHYWTHEVEKFVEDQE